MTLRQAVRAAMRRVQRQELASARRCPACGKPLPADVPTRLTVGKLSRRGGRYGGGRPEQDDEIGCCTCPGDGRVPTAGNAAMETAPPRSPTAPGEGDGLRPGPQDTDDRSGAGGAQPRQFRSSEGKRGPRARKPTSPVPPVGQLEHSRGPDADPVAARFYALSYDGEEAAPLPGAPIARLPEDT